MKVSLIVVQGKPEGKVIPLSMPRFKIGRGEDCHLRPNNEQVSRNHAEVVLEPDRVIVRDLGSRNGTLVNNRKIGNEEYVLKNKDLIQVGPLTFAVSIQGAPVEVGVKPKADPVTRAASLDDVSDDQVDSWLVGDQNNPAPERPSGVYTGDTMTFNAYKDASKPKSDPAQVAAPKSNPAQPVAAPKSNPAQPVAAAPPAKAAPAPPQPEPAPSAPESKPMSEAETVYDKLDDEDEPGEDLGDETEIDDEISEEGFVDESNPFHAAKKKPGAEPESKGDTAKQSFKDSSSAAEDLLRKMMERRRAGR
jgi:predicted component of type VI protein secretion system